jgi:hypothetical protein
MTKTTNIKNVKEIMLLNDVFQFEVKLLFDAIDLLVPPYADLKLVPDFPDLKLRLLYLDLPLLLDLVPIPCPAALIFSSSS